MSRNPLAIAALLLLSTGARADQGPPMRERHGLQTVSPSDPPITITINPEARISVALAGVLPSPAPCGTAATLRVKIINQGFVTARLEAQLVDAPAGVVLDFHPEPLRGVPEELRQLQMTLTKPGPTDLTIAFRAHLGIPDLGGRDRVHLLMRCQRL